MQTTFVIATTSIIVNKPVTISVWPGAQYPLCHYSQELLFYLFLLFLYRHPGAVQKIKIQ